MLVKSNLGPALCIRQAASIIFDRPFATNTEVMNFCRPASDRLLTQWLKDFDLSIYDSEDYIKECVLSYFLVSKEVSRGIGAWVKQFGISPGTTFFELYPGVGLNTVYCSALGFDCYICTGNAAQLAISEKLHRHFGLKQPTVLSEEEWRSRQFDFVGAFEVLEHFKEPKEVAKSLAAAVKPTGLLLESTGFGTSPYPGHYPSYRYNNVQLPPGVTLKVIHQNWKESGLTLIYNGFNDKPRVWAKDGRPEIPKKTVDDKRNFLGIQNFRLSS